VDVEQLADGLWRWTTAAAGCVYYEAPNAVVLFDPLVPAGEEETFFAYLDRDVERLGLPVSILLTEPDQERSAPVLRARYRADDRVPESVEVHALAGGRLAYFIRPHRVLVVATPCDSIAELPAELVLVSNP
jgi:hypothetical protein